MVRVVVAVALSLVLAGAVAPAAEAFGGRGKGGAPGGRPSGGHHHGGHHHRPQHGFNKGFAAPGGPFSGPSNGGYNRAFPGFDGPWGSGGFKHGFKGGPGFGWFAPWGTTTVYYGAGYDWPAPMNYPVTYYAPQYYYAPSYQQAPAAYAPPMASSVAVAPAPPASVVSFPTGRYELRGDGVSAPYQWVWIPDPPTAPPPEATPPASPPADRPAARGTQLYRWTDEDGTVHLTNRTDAVPPKHRKQAKSDPPA